MGDVAAATDGAGHALTQLKRVTTVVADTGDIDAIKQYQPTDATTNPSLLLAVVDKPEYQHYVAEAVAFGQQFPGSVTEKTLASWDRLAVLVGKAITDIVPRFVSTEVDARLSFDTDATVARALRLIQWYEDLGVNRERILIKIAATWEGIEAARQLEAQGIRCNMTLMFSLAQAIASADAGAYLISPFVGRILDWHKKAEGVDGYAINDDPGVQSVRSIYGYYKTYGYKTLVMGASFRNADEVKALAGCDLLTIGPKFLEELQADQSHLETVLSAASAKKYCSSDKITMNENCFRWMLNEDAMATEKLAEGIRAFAKDTVVLENKLMALVSAD